jgi:hypothetical protein
MLSQLHFKAAAHNPTRYVWIGDGIGGSVGSYGTQAIAITDNCYISCDVDGIVRILGPAWSTKELNVSRFMRAGCNLAERQHER